MPSPFPVALIATLMAVTAITAQAGTDLQADLSVHARLPQDESPRALENDRTVKPTGNVFLDPHRGGGALARKDLGKG